MECTEDAFKRPDKDTRVPQIIAGCDKGFGFLKVGLLLESFNCGDRPLLYRTFGQLDITIASLGAAGLDAYGHQGFAVGLLADKIESCADCLLECGLVQYQMVGRRDGNNSVLAL